MTFLTVLLLAILAVGLVAVAVLHRVERELRALRIEHRLDPVPFTSDELARQRTSCDNAASQVEIAQETLVERWGGKTLETPGEEEECRRQSQELDRLSRAYDGELRHLSMMVRANARVRLGRDLLSEVIEKVEADWMEQSLVRQRATMDALREDHER